MNFLKNKKYFNNFEQLNILNQVHSRINNIYNFTNRKKQSKVILLEKTSPNHFPTYVKVFKKNRNESGSPDIRINSYNNRNFHNDLNEINRNSLITEISQHRNNKLFDLNTSNNIYEINQKKKNLLKSKKNENKEEMNEGVRNIRFISISPSHNSKDENSEKRKSIERNIENEIKVEENINNNKINDFNSKHKIRYLLSKNYCGKRLNKRKNNHKSSFYNISGNYQANNRNNLRDNIKDNINISDNYTKNDSKRNNTIENNATTSINENKNGEIKRKNFLLKNKTTSNIQNNKKYIVQEEMHLNNTDNTFLKYRNYNNTIGIKLNDLILIEQKLNDIITSLNNKQNILENYLINESFEFISFYFNSSFQNKFPLLFNINNRIIIKSATNLNLFACLILYHLSTNPSIFIKVMSLLRRIFKIIKINLFLIIRKMEIYFGEEYTQQNEIYFKAFDYYLQENNIYDLKEKEILNIIIKNCISISKEIENILNYYQEINDKYYSDFQEIYMNISKIDENYMYEYFYYKLYNNSIENNISKHNTFINTENIKEDYEIEDQSQDNQYLDLIIISYKQNKKIPPFIKLKNNKKYTLVLDLEDTLISVKIDNEGKILCKPRPGLISFLNGIKPFYEIISFTKLSKEYSDIITKEIEGDKKLFDYNFYREHCALIGRQFIKDISRIGRDMKKVIMVDDSQENLKFYVNNGILICPYEGDDEIEDRVLFELKKLLILFFRQGYEDIRTAIKNYRKEIYDKITLGDRI